MNIRKETATIKIERYKSKQIKLLLLLIPYMCTWSCLIPWRMFQVKYINSAMKKFKDQDWRLMFVKMPTFKMKD